MKLKDGLILREVAGQFVVVPTGKRVQEVTSIVYISSSGAYLWDYMKDHEFQKEDLVKKIQEVLSTKYIDDAESWGVIDADRWNAFYKWLYENQLCDKDLTGVGFSNEYLPQ